MKNQNDLIISIAAGVLALGFALFFVFTRPTPQTPAAVDKIDVSKPAMPDPNIVMADSLPGGGNATGRGGFGGPGGPGMGMAGMMGARGMGGPGMAGPGMGGPRMGGMRSPGPGGAAGGKD